MYQFSSNHFFQITERLKIRSHGNAAYGSIDEPNWSDIMQTGRFCRIYGLYEDAIWCYNQAIELIDFLPIPNEGKSKMKSGSLSAKAMCLSTMGNNTEAIEVCEKAILLMPENFEAICNKGIALNNIGKYNDAITAHKEAISIKPDFANSWNAIGQIMVDQIKDYKNAIPYLDKAIQLSDGQDTHAWINKGNALSYLGKIEEAFLCWETAYEIDPEENVHAMLNKAIWLFKGQNKKEEALKLLNEVKGQISSENSFYNQLSQLYNRISSEN